MQIPQWLYQGISLTILAFIGAGVLVVLQNDANFAGDLGRTSEAITRIDQRFDDTVGRFEAAVGEQREILSGVEGRLSEKISDLQSDVQRIATAFEASQTDIRSMIVGLGLAKGTDLFTAGVIDGAVWAFPSDELAARWEDQGLTSQSVNSVLSGFRLYPVAVQERGAPTSPTSQAE